MDDTTTWQGSRWTALVAPAVPWSEAMARENRRADDAKRLTLTEADRVQLPAAWGEFLTRDWSHFATLTMNRSGSGPVPTEAALRGELRRFLDRVHSMVNQEPQYAAVMEGLRVGNGHWHLLIADCGYLSPSKVRRAWKAGVAEVEPYDPSRGAAYYLAKGIEREPDSIDVSGDLPPKLELIAPSRGVRVRVTRSDETIDLVAWIDAYARAIVEANLHGGVTPRPEAA